MKFESRTGNRAQVGLYPARFSEANDGKGSWGLLVIGDSAGHITDMDAKPARGTITRTDDTQPRPPELDTEPCGGDPGATQVTDDVTRTATVTFTRLR